MLTYEFLNSLTLSELQSLKLIKVKERLESKDEIWLELLKDCNNIDVFIGMHYEWWDEIDKNFNPIKYIKFKMSNNPDINTKDKLLLSLGLVKSLTEARKNGFTGEIIPGIMKYGKLNKIKIE